MFKNSELQTPDMQEFSPLYVSTSLVEPCAMEASDIMHWTSMKASMMKDSIMEPSVMEASVMLFWRLEYASATAVWQKFATIFGKQLGRGGG